MDFGVGLLVAVAIAFGAFYIVRLRARHEAERKSRADKAARTARADADAIRRTLAGRR